MKLSKELSEAAEEDLAAQVVRWIQDHGDSDAAACFSVATTDEVANGLKIDAKVAYAALSRAAKKKLSGAQRREMRKHPTDVGAYSSKEKAVGWRLWQVSMRPEQCS